jgi:isopentenyl-diphosphate delta-isomerase type 1
MGEELLEIVNEKGEVIRTAKRSEIHGNNQLLHRVVHLLVFNSKGEILLQKRSMTKDVAPGKWDTSVGGHVGVGETLEEALRREMEEELGISVKDTTFLYSYIHTNPYESELVYTFKCTYNGPFKHNKEEIDDLRFWSISELQEVVGKGILSDNFEEELQRYIEYTSERRQR